MMRSNRNTDDELTRQHPGAVRLVSILTLTHIYRVTALGLVINAATGTVPDVFIVPGFGDFLVGLTAPVIAFLLWRRRGLSVWLAAIVWHALALFDLLVGQSIQFLVQPENAVTPPPVVLMLALTIWIALDITHIVSIIQLCRSKLRAYYLTPFVEKEVRALSSAL